MRAQPAQRRHPHRHVGQEMADDALVGKAIKRDGVAIAAAIGLRDRLGRRRREWRHHLHACEQVARRDGPRAVRVAPHLMPPVDDPPRRIERRVDLRKHRRPERFPAMFLLAAPLQPDRNAGHRTCDQRGIARDVVRPIMPITARPLAVDAADAVGGHRDQLRDRGA
jgi:hypothetical protein